MSEVFFTSDTHFLHEPILTLGSGRPFASIEEHDETLIANWNDVVGRNDVVWHLGDYGLGDRRLALTYLRRMNGRKRLITGNHDSCFPGTTNGWRNVATYMEAGFETVLPFARIKLPSVAPDMPGRKVWLSHFPYDGDHKVPDRHSGARLRDEGQPLVHGHVHDLYTTALSAATGAVQVNVGVDRWSYRPVHAAEIARLVEALETSDRRAIPDA